jgi:hypothetical protein
MSAYESHLQARGLSQYTIDGAIDSSEWKRQSLRILFYLKENYGYQGEGIMRIGDYAPGWLADRNKTYMRVVTLAEATMQAVQRGSMLSREEVDALPETADLQTALRKIALVNVKKHSGESQSNGTEIRNESYANAGLLRDQIAALAPTVIVAGSTVCWHSLVCDVGLNKELEDRPKNTATLVNGIILCHCNHPAARRAEEFDIYEIHRMICEKLGMSR